MYDRYCSTTLRAGYCSTELNAENENEHNLLGNGDANAEMDYGSVVKRQDKYKQKKKLKIAKNN